MAKIPSWIGYIALSFVFSFVSCKKQAAKTSPPQHQNKDGLEKAKTDNTGFYQFLNDDPNASPFVAQKASVYAANGMVASAHPVASKVGVAILQQGGNAIDAAVATNFALAVVHPSAGNIGGGGFLVYRNAQGESFSLDYREKAPAKAHRDMYLDANASVIAGLSLNGHLASGTPGTVDGMVQMHQKFGRLSWAQLLEPAINLAENGVILTEKEARGLNRIKADLLQYNPTKTYFIKANNKDWQTGDTLLQKDLAKTLRLIKDKGRAGFYEGPVAEMLLDEMDNGCGIISQKDLNAYRAQWRKPLISSYKNYKIIGMPPPSSGGVALAQMLKYVEKYPLKRYGWHSDSATAVMIEAERRTYADRAKWLGDPDFVKVPVAALLEDKYLEKRFSDFSFERASDSKTIAPGMPVGHESMETTHFSVVDKEGNAVAITTTLNNSYGSKVVVDGAGFLLNDEMDDFSIKPGTPNMYGLIGYEANAIAPNKRMLSSMTPTIVEENGKLKMVLGTPGGSTIITSVFQVALNVLEHGMTMQQAVDARRFHHQWLPDKTTFEEGGFATSTLEKLKNKGYVMDAQKNTIGRMDCILKLPDGRLEAGSDVRGDDTAIGY